MKRLHNIQSAEQRFITLLSWALSCWRTVPRVGIEGAKPYNPILGEIFQCHWNHSCDDSRTEYFAEQVSHHPPISAFHIKNEKRQLCCYGWVKPKVVLGFNNVSSQLEGRYKAILYNHKEEYDVELPPVIVKGLLFGKPVLEIYGKMILSCKQTGYSAKIKFVSDNEKN